jgi:hypothetical protein
MSYVYNYITDEIITKLLLFVKIHKNPMQMVGIHDEYTKKIMTIIDDARISNYNPRANGAERRSGRTNSPRLFTPGERNALAKSKVHPGRCKTRAVKRLWRT